MKKLFLLAVAAALVVSALPQLVLAGGIENKQNFSARYAGSPARHASTDGADIAAYNPAGVMMKKDTGWTFEIDAQYILKDYDHDVNNVIPGLDSFTGSQDDPSLVPTLFATYKHDDKWGAFGSFTINLGGGYVDYKDGNVVTNMVETLIYSGQAAMMGLPLPAGTLTSNESIFSDTYYMTLTAGATYAFNENISMALGARYVKADKRVEAYADTPSAIPGFESLIAEYDESGNGFGFVVGFDFKLSDRTNFAVHYDSEVPVELETDIDSGNTVLGDAVLTALGKADGDKFDRNMPAVFCMGLSHKVTDKFTMDLALTYYLEEQCDWSGHEDDVSNSWDLGIAGTYQVCDNFRVSLGYLYTDVGISPENFDLVNMQGVPLDAHTIAIGFGYDINDKMTLEFGAMRIHYEEDSYTDMTTGTTVEYDKLNHNFALGFIYKL